MKRRNFLKGLTGAILFPTFAYAALKPETTRLIEGVTPAREILGKAPKIIAVVDDWPMQQYGDFISASHILSERDIIEYKALCRQQAKETFQALQVPDASDKIEYIVQQRMPEDPFALRSTVAWKVTIPAPQWQLVLSKHTNKQGYLKYVLKTRKRLVPISLNGNTQMVSRAQVRDYLRMVRG